MLRPNRLPGNSLRCLVQTWCVVNPMAARGAPTNLWEICTDRVRSIDASGVKRLRVARTDGRALDGRAVRVSRADGPRGDDGLGVRHGPVLLDAQLRHWLPADARRVLGYVLRDVRPRTRRGRYGCTGPLLLPERLHVHGFQGCNLTHRDARECLGAARRAATPPAKATLAIASIVPTQSTGAASATPTRSASSARSSKTRATVRSKRS